MIRLTDIGKSLEEKLKRDPIMLWLGENGKLVKSEFLEYCFLPPPHDKDICTELFSLKDDKRECIYDINNRKVSYNDGSYDVNFPSLSIYWSNSRRFGHLLAYKLIHKLIQYGFIKIENLQSFPRRSEDERLINTFQRFTVKYKVDQYEKWLKFQRSDDTTSNNPPRVIPWKESDSEFGFWINIKQYIKLRSLFPSGQAIFINHAFDREIYYYDISNGNTVELYILEKDDPTIIIFYDNQLNRSKIDCRVNNGVNLLYKPTGFTLPVQRGGQDSTNYKWDRTNLGGAIELDRQNMDEFFTPPKIKEITDFYIFVTKALL